MLRSLQRSVTALKRVLSFPLPMKEYFDSAPSSLVGYYSVSSRSWRLAPSTARLWMPFTRTSCR